MTTEYESVGTLGVSHSVCGQEALDASKYDICIFTASWESRSSEFIKTINFDEISDTACAVLYFNSKDEDIKKKKEEFISGLKSKCSSNLSVWSMNSSIETEVNFKLIKSKLEEARRTKKKPLKILCDISCMPKAYIIYLLGLSFRGEFASRVTLFYAEAKNYVFKPGQKFSSRHNLMTAGDWSIIQIPYFEGVSLCNSEHPLLISVGAEIKASIPLVERMEPQNLHVSLIENFANKIPKNVFNREAPFLNDLKNTYGAKIEEFPLGNVLKILNHAVTLSKEPIRCLAIGPKLHAIGLALAGIQTTNVEVMCRVPTSYSPTDVPPSGVNHLIEVTDRFDPDVY